MIRSVYPLVFLFLLVPPVQSQEAKDTVAPQIRIKNAVVYLDRRGQVRITPAIFDMGCTDNSGRFTLSASREVFGCSDVGEHNILITAQDESGNSTAAMASLIIKDTIPPDVFTRNQVIKLDSSGRIKPDPVLFNNGSTDACGIREMSIDPATFSCVDLGKMRIMFTVTDRNGNSASMPAIATVTVPDNPAVISGIISLELDEGGLAVLVPDDINLQTPNPCGIRISSIDPSRFECSDLGENKVRINLSDIKGNTTVSETTVKVVDLIPPVAVARDQVVILDENGMASVDVTAVDAGSHDNCGISNRTVEPSVFDCSQTGMNTITFTVTDLSGNKSTAKASVIVEDHIPPELTTQDLRLSIDPQGKVILPDMLIQKWGKDVCGISYVNLEISDFDCADIGTKEVMVTAKDKSGNIISKPVKVIVEDKIPPEVRTRNITVKVNEQGIATLEPGDIDNNSSDNCAIQTMTVNRKEFTRQQAGENEVELTVVDTSGNKSTGKAIVTVITE